MLNLDITTAEEKIKKFKYDAKSNKDNSNLSLKRFMDDDLTTTENSIMYTIIKQMIDNDSMHRIPTYSEVFHELIRLADLSLQSQSVK